MHRIYIPYMASQRSSHTHSLYRYASYTSMLWNLDIETSDIVRSPTRCNTVESGAKDHFPQSCYVLSAASQRACSQATNPKKG
jgi:hypothetical protein